MRIISTTEATSLTVASLGFDASYTDLQTPEALAALIRKVAAYYCPCTAETLTQTVTGLLAPLVATETLRDIVRDAIDQVVAYGDLTEVKDSDSAKFLIYLASPSFVRTADCRFLLFGVVPDGEDPTPPGLRSLAEVVMYSRRLQASDGNATEQAFLEAGFVRLRLESWLKCPISLPARDFVAKYDNALSNAGNPGTPDDVTIIDSNRPVHYYNGRWAKLKRQTGRFVARRSQAFGAPLWSYLEANDGVVTRLLDFPLNENHWRACDEAWHLLQACDAVAGHPQRFRTRPAAQKNTFTMDFFSPIPAWATRRWESVGVRTVPSSSLISFVFPGAQLDAECDFANERMWLERA
jgi:hypothetical protein